MRQRTIVILITAMVVSLPLVSVAWSRARLSGDAPKLLADSTADIRSQQMLGCDYNIILWPNKRAPVCAASEPPLLFPFGTWVLNQDGSIVWVTSAQLEELRDAAPGE